jgi:hypothetical protein
MEALKSNGAWPSLRLSAANETHPAAALKKIADSPQLYGRKKLTVLIAFGTY